MKHPINCGDSLEIAPKQQPRARRKHLLVRQRCHNNGTPITQPI